MTPHYVTIEDFRAETGLSYEAVRYRRAAGELEWVRDHGYIMININAYYARLDAQRKTVALRPTLTLPSGGITAWIEREQQRNRLEIRDRT